MASRTLLLGGHQLPCHSCGAWVPVASMIHGRCLLCCVGDGKCACCQMGLYEAEDRRSQSEVYEHADGVGVAEGAAVEARKRGEA